MGHTHTHEAGHGSGAVGGSGLHSLALGHGCVGGGHTGVPEDSSLLQFLQSCLVFGRNGDGIDGYGHNADAPFAGPLLRQGIIHGFRQLHGMSGKLMVTDAKPGDLSKGRLQAGEELALQLAVQSVTGVIAGHIGCQLLVEGDGVRDLVGIFTVATDGGIQIEAQVVVDNMEGYRSGSTILVAQDFLGIEVIHSLILAGIGSEGETGLEILPGILQTLAQTTVENGAFGGVIPGKGAGFRGKFHDPAQIYDHHGLAFVDNDNGAVADHIFTAFGVAAALAGTLLCLAHKHIVTHAVAVKIFSPLVSQDTAGCAECCFDKTHNDISL